MPLSSDCLAFWRFADNGLDSSPNAHNLTQVGTVPFVAGPLGLRGCTPDETNYWTAPAGFLTAFSSSTNFTVATWIYGTAFTAANACMSWGTANANQVCVIYPNNTSVANGIAIYCNGGGYKFDRDDGNPTINTWHHIALTVSSASSATLYLNGIQVATSALDLTNFAAMTAFHIGRYHNGGQPWNGNVAATGVWEPGLSAAEILRLAQGAVYPFVIDTGGFGMGLSIGL